MGYCKCLKTEAKGPGPAFFAMREAYGKQSLKTLFQVPGTTGSTTQGQLILGALLHDHTEREGKLNHSLYLFYIFVPTALYKVCHQVHLWSADRNQTGQDWVLWPGCDSL